MDTLEQMLRDPDMRRSFRNRMRSRKTEPRMLDDLFMVRFLAERDLDSLKHRAVSIQATLDNASGMGMIDECEGPWGQWLTLEQQACLDVVERVEAALTELVTA